jgi:uncharacterized membrane protein YfcA
MELTLIALVSFLAALLTFFSGFGLGTILLPVFALFFPVDLAVALTGVAHLFNNLFKLALVGKSADQPTLLRFGLPAIVAAFAGAWLLLRIADLPPLFQYNLGGRSFALTPVKFTIAALLIVFAILELLPFFERLHFRERYLPLGGVLSGFFGGLSGHQGALRSAFLIKAGLTKEAFIATGVVIACFVDITRLGVYATRYLSAELWAQLATVAAATGAAMAGSLLGNKLLKKVTLEFVRRLVAVLMIVMGLALGAGWI